MLRRSVVKDVFIQLIQKIKSAESSETIHKVSCSGARGLVIIFRRCGASCFKPECRATIFHQFRSLFDRISSQTVFVFTKVFGGIKAFCDVSNFS